MDLNKVYNDIQDNLAYVEFVFENVEVIRVNAELIKGLSIKGLSEQFSMYKYALREEVRYDRGTIVDDITIYLDISQVNYKGESQPNLYGNFLEVEEDAVKDLKEQYGKGDKEREQEVGRIVSTDSDKRVLKRLLADKDCPNICGINFIGKGKVQKVKEGRILTDNEYMLQLNLPYNEGLSSHHNEDKDDYINNNAEYSLNLKRNHQDLMLNVSMYKDMKHYDKLKQLTKELEDN